MEHVVDPTVREFLDVLAKQPKPKVYAPTPEQAREAFERLQTIRPAVKQPVDIDERELPVGPSGRVKVRILRPPGSKGILPVIVYCHGGAWVRGDYKMYERVANELTNRTGAALVFVEYQRAPDAMYPIAIEEVYAVTKWIVESGSQLCLDGSRLAIVGESAGGNIAAGVTLLARERRGPQIGFQVLWYPVTNGTFDMPSYKEFAEGCFLTLDAIKWFWNAYCPDLKTREQPMASPLRASLEQLAGLPPALIISCECDITRDECEAYAHRLIEAGVSVLAVRFEGVVHAFLGMDALVEVPANRAAMALSIYRLQEFLLGSNLEIDK